MIIRSLPVVALAFCSILNIAPAVGADAGVSHSIDADAAVSQARLSAYRDYVTTQTDTLVGMTKVLAREIKAGDLGAAQNAYAPAHRYLGRLAPIARSLQVLNKRMDARADDYPGREADPDFAGFHRIEYGLFANQSTDGLSDIADRLNRDARELRDEVKRLDIAPTVLADEAAALVTEMASTRLDGSEEPYSRTDLWDLEAGIDGVQQVVALDLLPSKDIARHLAEIGEELAKHKAGCGFKTYDELSAGDKAALKGAVAALAEALATPHGLSAID